MSGTRCDVAEGRIDVELLDRDFLYVRQSQRHATQSGGQDMRNILRLAMMTLLALPAGAADDIASKMVNDPTVGWAAFGACAKAELFKDPTVQGGGAERLTITGKSANPWDCGGSIGIVKPLAQGDVLLLAFWAKTEKGPAGADAIDVNANIQNNAAPYNSLGSAMIHVGPQWKMYFVQAVADKDYKANAVIAQLQLATNEQVMDLGPLFILNYGKDYDRSKLPKS